AVTGFLPGQRPTAMAALKARDRKPRRWLTLLGLRPSRLLRSMNALTSTGRSARSVSRARSESRRWTRRLMAFETWAAKVRGVVLEPPAQELADGASPILGCKQLEAIELAPRSKLELLGERLRGPLRVRDGPALSPPPSGVLPPGEPVAPRPQTGG